MDQRATRLLFPAFGMVPIKRDARKASMAALEAAPTCSTTGGSSGSTPRAPGRATAPCTAASGVAHLAMMTGAPIIPIGIVGTQRVQPIGSVVPRPFAGSVRLQSANRSGPTTTRRGGAASGGSSTT
ncbi:MAG: hypothetical protein R2697_18345 [Ilumatobacteraceae bacterium]